jgi:hypothetical protein
MHSHIEIDDAASSRMTGSATRRAALACAVLFLASLLALAVAPAQSAEPSLPKVVGSVPRFGADIAAAIGVPDLKAIGNARGRGGVAVHYPKLDRMYQLYNLTGGQYDQDLLIAERDMASFKLLRTLIVPDHVINAANGTAAAEWVTTFDHKHDRLYIAYTPLGSPVDTVTSKLPGLLGLDLKTFAFSDSTFPNFMVGTAGLLMNMVGMEYDESTDTLLVLQALTHGFSSLGNSVFLVGWKDEQLLAGGRLPQVTPRPIRACRRDPLNDANSQYMSPMMVVDAPDLDGDGAVKSWVILPCFSTTFSTNVVLVRLERATALDPQSTQEKAVVAPAGVTNWAVDQAHGRMYLVNNSAETDAWVYEAKTNAFVGIIALSPRNRLESTALSLGVDEKSGRLYGRAGSYGLMIAAAAQDPVPQADAYPHLAAIGGYRILVDSERNRILSLPGSTDSSGNGDYEVIAVPPPLPPPARDDPDARTTQVDEVAGKTVAQYGGNASAYGLRVLLSRGVSGAVPSNGNDTFVGPLYMNANSYCGFTDRELVLARVSKTELSNNSRFARASAVEPDNATVVDLKAPSRCDIYNSYPGPFSPLTLVLPYLNTTGVLGDADRAGVPASQTLNDNIGPKTTWDYTAADCASEGGEDKAGPNSSPLVGPTSVDCDEDKAIEANAESRLKPIDGLDVFVAKATASTKVYVDEEKGLVSESVSRLEGVSIAGISIGYIENSATSYAKGRNGSAKTLFGKPKIGFVNGNGVPSCDDKCDVDAVVRQLNSALAGRAEFRRIHPEERLAAGSPGGYQAGIIKSEKQQASDNSLTGDKSVEIPALEMVVYNDNAAIGRARQVYQFAGVRADSHYGIQMAGEGGGGLGNIGDVLDGATGDLLDVGAPLPNGGEALAVRVPAANENVLRRTIRQSAAGANYSLRIIFSNPREALVMATVWLLIFGPYVASRRRRALKAVITADPEGPFA